MCPRGQPSAGSICCVRAHTLGGGYVVAICEQLVSRCSHRVTGTLPVDVNKRRAFFVMTFIIVSFFIMLNSLTGCSADNLF